LRNGTVSAVLERIPQALARLLSDRNVSGVVLERAGIVPADQQEHRQPAQQQLVDSVTGDVAESGQKGRGYEIGLNQFMPVEDEALEALRLESTHTIDIEKFVPRSEIDERYLDSPYYLVPENQVGQDAFAVIREAMKRKNMVGLGRVVISRRERIVMLEPLHKGLMATTLHYAYEIRNAAEYFEDIPSIKLPGEMVELAEHILDTKAGHFDAREFEDRYENAVVEMLKRKQAGLPPAEQPEAAAPTNVVNLMDALRRSVEGKKPGRAASSKSAKKPAKEVERRTGKRKAG
jgi:DNA end-binding protein Ku